VTLRSLDLGVGHGTGARVDFGPLHQASLMAHALTDVELELRTSCAARAHVRARDVSFHLAAGCGVFRLGNRACIRNALRTDWDA
jgi:hypothetical protein